jgi:arginyl-tRNA synthetase
MTDEEFQRIKEEEKKHLRAKKRLQRTLKALKQRNEVQSVVQRMKRGASRLLDETESLVDSLRRTIAQDQARFDVALDEEIIEDEDLHAAEEELREERAEALVRRMKAEEASSRSRPSMSEDEGASDTDSEGDSEQEGPDKTIGRMGNLRPDDAS